MTENGSVTVRIGVTGHRAFQHVVAVTDAVDAVLDRVAPTNRRVVVVTSLAEGGDRLVARRVLRRPGARLEAVLPLPADDYADDFATDAARAEFDELLARADDVDVIAADGLDAREDAYERAGRAVVERSDVLIALWDGLPARGRAGCAEIVQYALDRGVAVEVVLVERGAVDP